MDKIRETSFEIYPIFWLEYDKFICDLLDKEIDTLVSEVNNDNFYEITNLFRLYFYIIERSLIVLNKKCESYTDILSLLTIFSLWCASIDNYLRTRTHIHSIEVSDIMIQLIRYSGIENNCISSNDVDELLEDRGGPTVLAENLKKNVFNIYLKIILNM